MDRRDAGHGWDETGQDGDQPHGTSQLAPDHTQALQACGARREGAGTEGHPVLGEREGHYSGHCSTAPTHRSGAPPG